MQQDYFKENQMNLIRNSSIYVLCSYVEAAIPFFILPILSFYLSVYDYGIISTYEAIFAILVTIISMSTHGSISVNYFKLPPDRFKVFVGNVIIFISLISLVFILLMNAFGFLLMDLLAIDFSSWGYVVVIASLGQAIFLNSQSILQMKEKPLMFSIVTLSKTLLNFSCSLLFVIYFHLSWEGRLGGMCATFILFGLIGFYILFKETTFKLILKKEDVKEILSFGIPLLPHALAAWVVFSLNKLFIANRVGIEETGLYSLAYQISMSINIFAASFNKAWAPYLFKVLSNGSEKEKIKVVKITYLYFIFIHFLCVILYSLSPLLLNLFFNPSYHGSLKYIPWISFGLAANGIYLMVTNYIFYVKKTYFLTYATVFSALLHITLNYCVVDTYGALGCAISMMVSFYVYFVLVFIIAQKLNPMPWLFWRKKYVVKYA